ncbi:MAG TPA: tetratricopeptide repeat protein, partial [Gemmataceae bacterium]|nr:tetratricopeptide repeat protein [Gemmataceae bacterium]
MDYEVGCSCGNFIPVSEAMAGSSIFCVCGRTVQVPSLSQLRVGQAIPDAAPLLDSHTQPSDDAPTRPSPFEEIIAPTQASLRIERGTQPGRTRPVMAALTADALWIQDTWQQWQVPLQALGDIEACRDNKVLVLTFRPDLPAERLELAFASSLEGERWCKELQERRLHLTVEIPRVDRPISEGVALVRKAPDMPHVVLARVSSTNQTRWMADRALQLRAGIRGANAVIKVHRQKCREMGWNACLISGLAVRVDDPFDRQRLRLRWYDEEVSTLVNRMLLLLIIQAAMLFLGAVFCVGASKLQIATGHTLPQALASAGLGLGLIYSWPVVMLALLRVLGWPQLVRGAGLAMLAGTTGRGLTVLLAHLLAVMSTSAELINGHFWILFDPFDWAFVVAGVVLFIRAWRLAGNAPLILPPEWHADSTARRVWGRSLLGMTCLYALAVLGSVGTMRYEASAFLAQPGVDPRREQQALLAFNEGANLANKGDLAGAEQSLQRSLRLWEELTAVRTAPALYRANLATTLNNLGWIREQQGRRDEAERYYARAVALADELGNDPHLDNDFKQTMGGA